MAQTVERSMLEQDLNPDDYVELTCPTEGCHKPQIARPREDGQLEFDECPCGFQMTDDPTMRLFAFSLGGPIFWNRIHKQDVARIGSSAAGR